MPDNLDDEINAALVRKRGTCKAKLSLFEKYLKTFEPKNELDANTVDRSVIIQLAQRIKDAEGLFQIFDDIQSEMEANVDDIETQLTHREEFYDRFYAAMSQAKQIHEIIDSQNYSRSDTGASANTGTSGQAEIIPSGGIKLPEINLPKFDGTFQTWLEFRDVYSSLIHDCPKINSIQKFHYLRASLIGPAQQVIQSIEFCSSNYDLAWKTLCDRFNNTHLLIQSHIKSIFHMDPIQEESPTKIRNLCDNISKHLKILSQLGEPTQYWDSLIIYIASSRLDINTAREWEKTKSRLETTDLEKFKEFLYQRADLLQTLNTNFGAMSIDGKYSNSKSNKSHEVRQSRGLFNVAENIQKNSKTGLICYICKGDHGVYYCPQFLALPIQEKRAKVRQLQLCQNCLRRNHQAKDCKWSGCKYCHEKHNTTLHGQTNNRKALAALSNNDTTKDEPSINQDYQQEDSSNCYFSRTQTAMLSTARVSVPSVNGNLVSARVLLDCGSQSSFITTEFSKRIKVTLEDAHLTISGINDRTSYSNKRCNIMSRSIHNDYSIRLNCFVIDKITGSVPGRHFDGRQLRIPVDIQLADPEFHIPSKIDILIGSDAFWEILSSGQYRLNQHGPFLQNTRFGWVVAGPFDVFTANSTCNFNKTTIANDSVQAQIAKFWEIEEVTPQLPVFSAEENLCEKSFKDTTIIHDSRYMVSLPLKKSPDLLGESREKAIKQFASLERKLNRDEKLRTLYTDFLGEYEHLGHMTEVTEARHQPEYYLPHHGVLRESSSTTKLRVVFNASSPTSTGISLNDLQMNGPTIQEELISILLRFRMHAIVISSDIKMMYRQILLNPEQRKLQKIVWRSDPSQPLRTYQLNTVTYGTTAASFLAIRCLHQLASECEQTHPDIAQIIRRAMYVDDLLTSVDTPEEADHICRTITEVFLSRGFELRKWKSNDPSILGGLHTDNSCINFSTEKETCNKTLGLSWICNSDSLIFKINPSDHRKITKRVILSQIASIFDPLGLISPCIIIAKTLMQKLWLEKLDWDQVVPSDISKFWIDFLRELTCINELQIQRKVICDSPKSIYLHGFSDASEVSYGACIYVVTENISGEYSSHLLCSKSKVASLKSITIPRLELCAALLLSRLLAKVKDSIDVKIRGVYCWTDSTIVLGWLKTQPNMLKPFINNRVAEIQDLTGSYTWLHVTTNNNPADLVSRGVRPRLIQTCRMWWFGPEWLTNDPSQWPSSVVPVVREDQLPEIRVCNVSSSELARFPFERFSSWLKLKRSTAYMFRFINNCQKASSNRIQSIHLTSTEIEAATENLLKYAQSEMFPDELRLLKKSQDLSKTSSILNLNPFLDDKGIMRVGGRLSNSDFTYSKKHPIILSSNHHITCLIFRYEHEALLHAGPQLLLSHIRETYWPTSGRHLARKTFRNCVKCARYRNQTIQPIMADLPEARVKCTFPFSTVGVDYAGPFLMRDRRGRGSKLIKCWIALYICFSTRAIHLEIVLSLSAEDFIQSFKRFISRRGKPAHVYSDNGTNFTKANKDLQELAAFFQENFGPIETQASNIGVSWHFIPTNSPHFGGLWEAGVKSVKTHLKRVIGTQTLFFFDFYTLLIHIEAILNSRPLIPLSSEPSDLSTLSPAHFLIGRPLLSLPEVSYADVSENRLTQYERIQKLHEQFWRRWSLEYVSELQKRTRWKTNKGSLQIGQMVLVRDNNLPPMKWCLGRIINLIRGPDEVPRVAAIRTAGGIISRAVVRLCPLPVKVQGIESQDFQGRGHVNACVGAGCQRPSYSGVAQKKTHNHEVRSDSGDRAKTAGQEDDEARKKGDRQNHNGCRD